MQRKTKGEASAERKVGSLGPELEVLYCRCSGVRLCQAQYVWWGFLRVDRGQSESKQEAGEEVELG